MTTKQHLIVSIDLKDRIINNKVISCYIPKLNNIPVLGENGYILKESLNNGIIKDNKELAMKFIQIKIDEINSFMEKNSKYLHNKWNYIKNDEDNTFPDEGIEVIVSDNINEDVAWYIRSGEYKWLKTNIKNDEVNDFTSFIPTKWKIIDLDKYFE